MKTFLIFLCWCILFLLSWPLAILALVLFPLVWLLVLPFRVLFIVAEAGFALLKAILLLPARLFGYKYKT
jgi:hypothetical protein